MGLVKRDEYESVVDKLRDADLELSRVRNDLEEVRSQKVQVVDASEILARIEKLAEKPKAPSRAAQK